MCWSAEVAGAFTVLEVGLAIFLWKRNASPRDRWILPLALSVTAIEALEVVIWLSKPVSFADTGENAAASCSASNKLATTLAYFVLLGQPVFDGMFLQTTAKGVLRSHFHLYWVIAMGMYAAALYAFVSALWTAGDDSIALDADTIASADSLYSDHTCSYVGPRGHLLWQFKVGSLAIPAAVEAGYFVLSFSWFLYKPLSLGASFFIGLNAMLVGNFVYFSGSKEAYSVWCWEALFIYLFVVIEPYVFPPHEHRAVKAEKAVKGLTSAALNVGAGGMGSRLRSRTPAKHAK